MSRFQLFVLSGIVILLAATFLSDRQDPVQRTFRELIDTAQLESDVHPIEKLGKVREVLRFFADSVLVQIESQRDERVVRAVNRKALLNRLNGFYGSLDSLQVSGVIQEADRSEEIRAEIAAEIRLLGRQLGSDDPFLEVLQLRMIFEELEDGWKIVQVTGQRITTGDET